MIVPGTMRVFHTPGGARLKLDLPPGGENADATMKKNKDVVSAYMVKNQS